MRNHRTFTFLIGIFFILLLGCEDIADREKFKRPDWLPGKLYTTVAVQDNLSMFAECLKLTGLDSILDVSGSWSVFAPSDEAINNYLIENQYGSITDIPLANLKKITEFHIVQNPWTVEQLQILSPYGWRTEDATDQSFYAYKRQTKLKNPNEKYWIKRQKGSEKIVSDSTDADAYKKVFAESRKYVPIFYDEYMNVNGISAEDYNFYFDRPYEQGNIYYAGGKILQSDIFSENGFLHIIDRVVEPMLNAQELLDRDLQGETYKRFLEMVNWYYPSFEPNLDATYDQPAIRLGGFADTLWDLKYSDLAFNLHNERTGSIGTSSDESLVRHNGMIIPTDEAFGEFVDGILTDKSGYPHWHDYKSLPRDLVELILPQHFKSSPIYPSGSNYQNIFWGGGRFHQNEGDIIRKEFGSNSTFIGLNNYIPDKVFTTVTAPVFLRPSYTTFRLALQYTSTHDIIANSNSELCFFPIIDYALEIDSSLLLTWISQENNYYNFRRLDRATKQMGSVGRNELRNMILDHVGTALPNGSANKEFIPNIRGKYIIWNNGDNTVQGDLPSKFGFNGENIEPDNPGRMEGPFNLGQVWSVRSWFNFSNRSMYAALSQHPEFLRLLAKAGLFNQSSLSFPFLNNNENYTIFVPSEEALNNFQADLLSIEDLKKVLEYHFLEGEMIFTDNKKFSDVYNTTGNTTLNIRTGPDIIEVLDRYGDTYVSIPEQEGVTNIMISQGSQVRSVLHNIDKVLVY